MQNEMKFDGPIAGENYTSDTRNYPWHRPPDLVEYDDIVEHLLEKISAPDTLPNIMSTLSTGATVAGITDFVILNGIGEGKFAIDMGLLAAGPVARFIQIMADDFNVEHDMGIDDDVVPLTPNMIKNLEESMGEEVLPETVQEIPETDNEASEEGEGFMSPPDGPAPTDEQDAMLGYSQDSEELEEEING
jgi:hypothetical protein